MAKRILHKLVEVIGVNGDSVSIVSDGDELRVVTYNGGLKVRPMSQSGQMAARLAIRLLRFARSTAGK